MKSKIETIVRQVVFDYYNKLSNTSTLQHRLVIVIDEQPILEQENFWNQLMKFKHQLNEEYAITFCTPRYIEQIGTTEQYVVNEDNLNSIFSEMKSSDVIILANPQYSNLAKLALSIDDTRIMWLLTQMQLYGKQIVYINDSFLEDSIKNITIPSKVKERINSYQRQLRQENVAFVTWIDLEKWVQSFFDNYTPKRHIVLVKHIEEIIAKGKSELIVPKNSLITPLCIEYAKDTGVVIKTKE